MESCFNKRFKITIQKKSATVFEVIWREKTFAFKKIWRVADY